MPSTQLNLSKGTVIAGKYEVERVLGQGGMGIVVAARHRELDDRVAIKFLLPEVADQAQSLARFLTEARAARKLKTEHATKVSDVGTMPETGAPFIVMELLEGRDLGSLLQAEGPLRIDLAVEYLLQACVAVAEAHTQGIIHRDLKPPNLFLTQRLDGSPCIKVLDFGIAKMTRTPTPSVTRTSTAMGTVLYSAPEQLMSAKTVDQRSDIWSLGVTLYELLTGAVPFEGDDFAVLVGTILMHPHMPVQHRRREVPPGLIALIDRSLTKDRDGRPSTVLELAEGLAPFGSGDSSRSLSAIRRLFSVVEVVRQEAPRENPDVARGATVLAVTVEAPADPTAGVLAQRQADSAVPFSVPRSVERRPEGLRRRLLFGLAGVGLLALGGWGAWAARTRGVSIAPPQAARATLTTTSVPITAPAARVEPVAAVPSSSTAVPNSSAAPRATASTAVPTTSALGPTPSPKKAAARPMSEQDRQIAKCQGKLPLFDAKTERLLKRAENSDDPDMQVKADEVRKSVSEANKKKCDQLRAEGVLE